ncbi:MAG: hypothetical protein JOZ62_18055 [Acidobacteriaceae bacterium]|nr:hypothetical protein [Acidobacteriaceae bacterium]
MRTKYKLAAAFCAIFPTALISTGCKTQPAHPNQINAFDGTSYDSLTLAQGALTSLRVQVSTGYSQYAPEFNRAAAAYSTALNAYSIYRTAVMASNQAQVSVAIQNLTISIVLLENTFEADMHASPTTTQKIRSRAARLRSGDGANVSAIDILTELEIAASIAEAVPQAQPYAALAAVVIAATDEAVAAENAAAGQPIDLSTIQPIAPIL